MNIITDGSSSFNLTKVIKEYKIEKMAEVGLHGAKGARIILRACKDILKEYWGIDKYNMIWPDQKNYYPRLTVNEDWNNVYKHACKYMPFFPQLRILTMESADAAALFSKRYFPDGYFDFVYIDANHYYEYVKRDIELWTPAVKKDGFIGGHDYGTIRFPGVKKAVDEIFGEEKITIYTNQKVWLFKC